MSYSVVGKCSLCGGQVCVPSAYYGTPPKRCQSCGAVADASDLLPEIKMKKVKIEDISPEFDSLFKKNFKDLLA